MNAHKDLTRYNVISIRVNELELDIINQICDEKNISASKACRLLMFRDAQLQQVMGLITQKEK